MATNQKSARTQKTKGRSKQQQIGSESSKSTSAKSKTREQADDDLTLDTERRKGKSL